MNVNMIRIGLAMKNKQLTFYQIVSCFSFVGGTNSAFIAGCSCMDLLGKIYGNNEMRTWVTIAKAITQVAILVEMVAPLIVGATHIFWQQ